MAKTTAARLPGKDLQPSKGQQVAVRSVVLGTAGHIDHGKTALVLALTGTDTDRLPEEKARGITIDLGFAALALTGPGGQQFDVSLIDVPGHHAFVRNMLAGAGGIDAVLLVVAADEGPRAQTVEHLQICRMLGIERGIVVLTKRDAVNAERLAAVHDEVADLVAGTFLEGAPVLAVSALRREGIAELRAALVRLVAEVPQRSADQVVRLPVDRVFSVKGFGTVVTGTLQAGAVRAGQSMLLEPQRRGMRVRGVQVHGKARPEATAPNRVALNLAGIDVAEVHRGDTVVPENTLEPTRVLDVEVDVLPGAPPLRHRQRVRVHAFASESLGTLLLYDEPSEGALEGPQLARLRLTKPMLLVPGDRFVLRQPSPALTVGGGRVLDATPMARLRRTAAQPWLQRLREGGSAGEVLLRVQRRGTEGLSQQHLVAETGRTREALQRALQPLVAGGAVVSVPGMDGVIAREALEEAETGVLREVGRAKSGTAARAELRSKLRLQESIFALALTRLQAARKLAVQGDAIALPSVVDGSQQGRPVDARAAEVERLYRRAGLASPIVSEAAQQLGMGANEIRGFLTALLRAGKLVRLGSDALLVHREALEQLTQRLQQQRGKSLDVGAFKALTGLSRKHAIPLLEYLDGVRVTRNVGGTRVVV